MLPSTPIVKSLRSVRFPDESDVVPRTDTAYGAVPLCPVMPLDAIVRTTSVESGSEIYRIGALPAIAKRVIVMSGTGPALLSSAASVAGTIV